MELRQRLVDFVREQRATGRQLIAIAKRVGVNPAAAPKESKTLRVRFVTSLANDTRFSLDAGDRYRTFQTCRLRIHVGQRGV